jgi:hypothetical protein
MLLRNIFKYLIHENFLNVRNVKNLFGNLFVSFIDSLLPLLDFLAISSKKSRGKVITRN